MHGLNQSFHKNYEQWYPLHHFVFYPVLIAMIITSIRHLLQEMANVKQAILQWLPDPMRV